MDVYPDLRLNIYECLLNSNNVSADQHNRLAILHVELSINRKKLIYAHSSKY